MKKRIHGRKADGCWSTALDLAAALDLPAEPPASGLAVCLQLAASLAQQRAAGGSVLLALTGRRPLPPTFSLL